MPGAGVQILVERVGGSEVRGAAGHERQCTDHASTRFLTDRVLAAVVAGWTREDGAPAPPAARRAEGALEPVRKLVTDERNGSLRGPPHIGCERADRGRSGRRQIRTSTQRRQSAAPSWIVPTVARMVLGGTASPPPVGRAGTADIRKRPLTLEDVGERL